MRRGKVISKKLKRIQAKDGLTRDDLDKKADIKHTTFLKVIGVSVYQPSVQTMEKIAMGLFASFEYLIK